MHSFFTILRIIQENPEKSDKNDISLSVCSLPLKPNQGDLYRTQQHHAQVAMLRSS